MTDWLSPLYAERDEMRAKANQAMLKRHALDKQLAKLNQEISDYEQEYVRIDQAIAAATPQAAQ
jgi:uncharacterized coiled-coil DUF342 family protein